MKDNKITSRYRIRRLREGDLEAVLRVERASFGEDAYDRKLFAEYIRVCGDLFLVAEGPRGVCGYCLGWARGDRAEIVSLAVAPAERGRGAASALLESMLRRFGRRQVARVTLMVRLSNLPARAIYEKYQFTKVRRVPKYYEDGADGILMRRLLAAPAQSGRAS